MKNQNEISSAYTLEIPCVKTECLERMVLSDHVGCTDWFPILIIILSKITSLSPPCGNENSFYGSLRKHPVCCTFVSAYVATIFRLNDSNRIELLLPTEFDRQLGYQTNVHIYEPVKITCNSHDTEISLYLLTVDASKYASGRDSVSIMQFGRCWMKKIEELIY